MKSMSRLHWLQFLLLSCVLFFSVQTSLLHAGQVGVLAGRIVDISGEPVKNAEVYIFDSTDVKRPADFISNRTVEDGRYQVQLPPGNYRAVAFYRQGGARFGPLSSDDKHSGEPVVLEITAGSSYTMDFTVMNLREAARKHQKKNAELVRVTGKVVRESGAPVAMAYAMAHNSQQFGSLPDYISAWTDEQGGYTLYLPAGRYYLGASLGFPPKHGYNLYLDQQVVVDTDKVDLVVDKEKQ